ncbi:MAG TPA: ABC transporter permease, partial [Candidatus Eisenbacteria bacterium]|nr:ABC transporter permease [Candidatus Eisenbacteria bacterium]
MLKLLQGDGGKPTATLLVADQDSTFLSALLLGATQRGELGDIIKSETVSETEGRRLLDKGKASGLLIIPPGFADGIFDQKPVTLTLLTNPSQRILPGILEETLHTFVEGLNVSGRLLNGSLNPLLRQLRESEDVPADALIAEFSVGSNQLIRRVRPYLFPPAIQVATVNLEAPKNDSPERSFGDIFFPSMFFMAIVFVAQSLSDDVWKEKTRGTLRRALTTPLSLFSFMAGKILAAALLLAVVSFIALAAARWMLHLPFSGIPLAALWTTLAGTFMLLFFIALQLSASSQRGGHLLANMITFPLVMAGGAFFPFEIMPEWLARIGKWTPNGWSLLRLREILDGAPRPDLLGVTALALLALGSVLFILSVMRLSRFARSA